MTEEATKDFYLSLNDKHGTIKGYIDDYGNLWVIFVQDDDPYNLNVINFYGKEDLDNG